MILVHDRPFIATVFGYSPQMRILNCLLDFLTNDFTKKEMIQPLGMSKQTSSPHRETHGRA